MSLLLTSNSFLSSFVISCWLSRKKKRKKCMNKWMWTWVFYVASVKFDVRHLYIFMKNKLLFFVWLLLLYLIVSHYAIGIDTWTKHRLLHFIHMSSSICLMLVSNAHGIKSSSIRCEISDWSSWRLQCVWIWNKGWKLFLFGSRTLIWWE